MPAPEGNTFAQGHGRPSSYQPAYDELAYNYCLLGATDKELAQFFDVAESTINSWKTEHLSFSESIKRGKEIADAKVAQSLFHLATGYSHADTDIRVVDHEIVMTPITKHYPPSATAQIFWLKNRQKKLWRDKVEVETKQVGTQTVRRNEDSGDIVIEYGDND